MSMSRIKTEKSKAPENSPKHLRLHQNVLRKRSINRLGVAQHTEEKQQKNSEKVNNYIQNRQK